MRASHRLMRYLGMSLLVLVLLGGVLPGASVHAEPAADTTTYVVKAGDRLADIAARYGVSVAAIVSANGLANPDVIYAGQRLVIPASGGPAASGVTPTPVSTVAPSVYHTVKFGDTLEKIARAYGVSAAAISRANSISDPDVIWVGQRLLIPTGQQAGSDGSQGGPAPAPTSTPVPRPTAAKDTIHVVQSGDTLGRIAQRYGTTVAAIVAANGLGSADLIRVGMRLIIPKGGGAVSAAQPLRATKFVVSISQQRCWLYRGETVIAKWVCSTGRSGSGTRPGTYRIQSKLAKAYGSTWNIWMPYWLGIYWAGTSENGIHGLPWNAKTGAQVWTGYVGTPITYGCVMLDNVNAKMLYDAAYIGMPVVIKW